MKTDRTIFSALCAVALLLSVAACATAPRAPGACLYTQGTDFFMGRSVASGDNVSDADWEAFLAEVVHDQYKGLTVFDATGYWEGKREPTKVMTILHHGAAADHRKLDAIAAEYAKRFRQQAVLRADYETCATLVGAKGPLK